MDQAAFHPAGKGCSEGLYDTEGFYRKKGVAEETSAKGKKGLLRLGYLLREEGMIRASSCRLPLLPLGVGRMERSLSVTDYLTAA